MAEPSAELLESYVRLLDPVRSGQADTRPALSQRTGLGRTAITQRTTTLAWGVGLGLPGPVEFATARPSEPPIMPGWNDYPVRERLLARYDAPVWVDNEVNLLCLGELRAPGRSGELGDLLYVKIGTGIRAGISHAGQLHRGAQGYAGDIGHAAVSDDSTVVCRCGKTGCLEAIAGGAALARDGERLATSTTRRRSCSAVRSRAPAICSSPPSARPSIADHCHCRPANCTSTRPGDQRPRPSRCRHEVVGHTPGWRPPAVKL